LIPVLATALLQTLLAGTPTEFLLPLPGEAIQDSNAAILVRMPASVHRVEFVLTGAKTLRVAATPLGDDLHSAALPRLAKGAWKLRVSGMDSTGAQILRDSMTFATTPLAPTVASTTAGTAPQPSKESPTAAATPKQSLFLAFDAGYRQGLSEGTLESWQPLRLENGSYAAGEDQAVLDRTYSASATALWDYRLGKLRLRTRTVADLGDQAGQNQALHRLSFQGTYGPWLDVQLGDQHPSWSPLLMDGTRIRGFGAGLSATNDGDPWGRVRYVAGWNRRATDAAILHFADGTSDTVGGTYDRFVQAVHVGFGGGQRALWGLTVLHAIDDTTDRDMALFDIDTLGSPRPRENLAVGTDLQLWFWKRRIEVFGHVATSLVTDNIRLGASTSERSKDAGLDRLDVLSPVFTANSSTRGLEALLADDLGGAEVWDFVSDNSSARAGVRLSQDLAGAGRMSNEVRWVHAGTSWESFLRGSALPAQSGVEVLHSSNWARGRVFFSATAGLYTIPRAAVEDADRTRIAASVSVTPEDAMPGVYLDGGTDWTEEPSGGRSDSWNGGAGLYQTFRPIPDHMATTSAGYSVVSSEGQVDSSDAVRTQFFQNAVNAQIRWRFPAPIELRTGGQFSTSNSKLTLQGGDQDAETSTIHGTMGATAWFMDRKLEASLDGGLDHRSGEAEATGIRQWDQRTRLVWNLPADQALRLSQRFVQIVDGRGDLRLDAGWEKFF
jgi:hypothetical protein